MSRTFTIEPDTVPGYWMVLRDGVPMREPESSKLMLFGSAAAASNWIDEHAPIASFASDELREMLATLNEERRDDDRRTAICEELTLRLIAAEMPEDWEIWHSDQLGGWAISRDHGAVVVGVGYRTLQQAFGVARRTLADD